MPICVSCLFSRLSFLTPAVKDWRTLIIHAHTHRHFPYNDTFLPWQPFVMLHGKDGFFLLHQHAFPMHANTYSFSFPFAWPLPCTRYAHNNILEEGHFCVIFLPGKWRHTPALPKYEKKKKRKKENIEVYWRRRQCLYATSPDFSSFFLGCFSSFLLWDRSCLGSIFEVEKRGKKLRRKKKKKTGCEILKKNPKRKFPAQQLQSGQTNIF